MLSKKQMYMQLQSNNCSICGKHMTLDKASWDHVVPTSKGGTNSSSNIVLAHQSCNSAKGNSDPSVRELAVVNKLYRLLGTKYCMYWITYSQGRLRTILARSSEYKLTLYAQTLTRLMFDVTNVKHISSVNKRSLTLILLRLYSLVIEAVHLKSTKDKLFIDATAANKAITNFWYTE